MVEYTVDGRSFINGKPLHEHTSQEMWNSLLLANSASHLVKTSLQTSGTFSFTIFKNFLIFASFLKIMPHKWEFFVFAII